MKKYVVLSFVLLGLITKAQEVAKASVEKSLNSVQAGLFSISFQNESRLDRKLTLRSEAGIATGRASIKYPDGHYENSFLVFPFINIEPRWFYSLDRRSLLEKNIKNNSSNYFSLLSSYYFSQAALVNTKDFKVAPLIQIIPEYGFRRSVGKKFFWEASAGIGYRHNFLDKSYTYTIKENEVVFDIQYKFGYIF